MSSRVLIISSTTDGSARVDMSPRSSNSLAAILRKMRRIIFPERVFGRAGANRIASGDAIGPIISRTFAVISLRAFSRLRSCPDFRVT